MDHLQSWCLVLERTFLTFNWSEHAKKHTYTRRTYFTPREIESLIFEYLRGGNPYIGEFDGLTKFKALPSMLKNLRFDKLKVDIKMLLDGDFLAIVEFIALVVHFLNS
ncbi:unnamed protein product [Rhizophagus irregularis]|nr:unnamed protein product [Rhizophagus irregularis]CAB4446508.1 unnamed protein product [Rhizophagus irregularis]